jgi:ATP-dependent Clp protease ATP-binding subunit ClpA
VLGRPVCLQPLTFLVLCVVQLDRVRKRVADRKIKIEVTESAIKLLGVMGYDPAYGARPVKVSPRGLAIFLC